jgi:signal transduction histidine kinase
MNITALRNFFDINFELVLFTSGLVFFVMGLAISVQSRQHSRLQLARSIGWLSLFGIAHGLHEWGLLFIPFQAIYMNAVGIYLLQLIQILILGAAFFALYTFGADLLHDKWPHLSTIPYLMTLIWLIIIVALEIRFDMGMGWLQQQATILAKYLLAFPGGLLAAYGLYYQAERYIRPVNLQQIYRTMIMASITLLMYALFEGLFVPYGSFFPANLLNQSLLVKFTGIPASVYLSLIGLGLALTVMRVLEVFDLETGRLIEQMRLEQSLAMERDRIGREIHDGAIQTIYTAGLIVESTQRRVKDDPVLSKRLNRVMTALNDTVASLRANMGELRQEPHPASLTEALRQRTQDPRLTTIMPVELVLELPATNMFNRAQITHILAIVSEALTNAARHARPSCAQVKASSEDGQFVLSVYDDGVGFTPKPLEESGYGLRNMRDRARLLGGELLINSEPGKGSCITLKVPWETL